MSFQEPTMAGEILTGEPGFSTESAEEILETEKRTGSTLIFFSSSSSSVLFRYGSCIENLVT